jgi:hypothetical protein
MSKLPEDAIEPTPEAQTVADAATQARRLRPSPAAPVERDPRADGCIDEHLGGSITPATNVTVGNSFNCLSFSQQTRGQCFCEICGCNCLSV